MGNKPIPIGKGGNFDTRKNPFQLKDVEPRCKLTDCPAILPAIEMAIAAGSAVLVGSTRDGGALVLTILDGDDRHRTYCHTLQELEQAALALRDLYV